MHPFSTPANIRKSKDALGPNGLKFSVEKLKKPYANKVLNINNGWL